MEARKNELLLAGIGIDVTHGEDARLAGLKLLGVHVQRLALHGETPVRNGAQLRLQAEERKHLVHAQFWLRAVRGLHSGASERTVRGLQRLDSAFDELQLARRFQFAHARHGSGRRTKLGSAMDKRDAGCLAGKVDCPVQCGVATAADDQVLAVILLRIANAVVHLLAFEGFHTVHHEAARLK